MSATVTGLGGGLMAFLKLFVSADTVHVNFSGEILAMTIFGGVGSFLGPTLGAFFYIMFREVLTGYTSAWQFCFGLLFLAFLLFCPSGLGGVGGRLLAPLRKKREGIGAMAARVTPQPGQEIPAFLREHSPLAGTILSCAGVVKRFGGFTAVAGVDLKLADRKLHALIGPNGAGKTTLFNAISGMFASDGGRIVLDHTPIAGLPAEQVVKQGLARSFQITSLFPALSVWENLRLAVQARDARRFNAWTRSGALPQATAKTREL